jgi:hypothetical protein
MEGGLVAVRSDPLRAVLVIIAAFTALTGVVEIVAPGPVLELLGAESSATAKHLFGTVGMFMVVVGGLLTVVLLRPAPDRDVVLWGALQKAGAFAAVTIGVISGTFAALALAVAVFDLATAVLLLAYRNRLPARVAQ